MKWSAFAVIAATAALVQVGAAPTLLTISSSVQEGVSPITGLRFGHAVQPMPMPDEGDHEVGKFPHPPPPPSPPIPGIPPPPPHEGLPYPHPGGKYPVPPRRFRHRPACGGHRAKAMMILQKFKLKAIEVSNTIRKALGWPLIEVKVYYHHAHKSKEAPGRIHVDGGFVSILPFPAPNHDVNGDWVPVSVSHVPPVPPQHDAPDHNKKHEDDHAHRHGHWHGHRLHGSFLSRLHRSLMNLGRWEGRAVAFVIGCGIGVLLRMFWVLGIVAYRTLRGERDDGYVSVTLMEEYDSDDGETVISAPTSPKTAEPPKYTYPVDEKVTA